MGALGSAGHPACSSAATGAGPRTAPLAAARPRTIHVAGDSTAAVFAADDARVGWGAVLGEKVPGVAIDAAARSGRSSKSYFDEGHWAALIGRVAAGDLVLIEFGHNDEKPDPARATDPATTFREFLRHYVADARQQRALPVLLTPICRRRFEGQRVRQTHGDFPDATRQVAGEVGVPLVDMTHKTTELLEGLGPAASAELFAPDDHTHTNLRGARAMANLVLAGLVELGFVVPKRPS